MADLSMRLPGLVRSMQLHRDYLHRPSGLVGWCTTYSPPADSCPGGKPFTVFSPARQQFGSLAGTNFTALLEDLEPWDPPDFTNPEEVTAWLT